MTKPHQTLLIELHASVRGAHSQKAFEFDHLFLENLPSTMQKLYAILKTMRPKQWTKNLLLFAGLIFSHNLTDTSRGLRAVAAFVVFCILSGVVYFINDIKDLESDRNHPLKRQRPIASGELGVTTAIVVAGLLAAVGLAWAFTLNLKFAAITSVYFLLMIAYSFFLKHLVILDLMVVAMGFVIRSIAGIYAIENPGEHIPITPWFITCVLFLALFLAICKRRHELILLAGKATSHRPVLEHYSPAFLDQMVSVVTTATVMSYALYVTSGVKKESVHHHEHMIWTLPFVLYGIFRYLYLVYRRDEGGAPEALLLKDPGLIATVILWLVSILWVFYL